MMMHFPFLSQRLTTNNNNNNNHTDAAASGAAGRSNNNAEDTTTTTTTTTTAAATTNSQTSRSQRLTTNNNISTVDAANTSTAGRSINNVEETTTTATTMASAAARANSQTLTLSPQSSIVQGSQTTASSNNTTFESSTSRGDWTGDECYLLAQAWLHVSKDPIKGTDRKSDSMWSQISQDYNRRVRLVRAAHPDLSIKTRDQKMLSNFWSGTMNKAMLKFAAICQQHPPTSGENDVDKYHERMMIMYKKQKRKGYPVQFRKFLRGYNHVKDEPKWLKNAKPTKPSASGQKDNDRELQTKRKRPGGRDLAKHNDFVNKKAKEVSNNAHAKIEEKWSTIEGHLSDIKGSYQSMLACIVMQNAPSEELKDEFFQTMANKTMANLRQSNSDVE